MANAVDLPIGSIVATATVPYIRFSGPGGLHPEPWAGGALARSRSDDEIDDLIQRGEATVLRVGTGECIDKEN